MYDNKFRRFLPGKTSVQSVESKSRSAATGFYHHHYSFAGRPNGTGDVVLVTARVTNMETMGAERYARLGDPTFPRPARLFKLCVLTNRKRRTDVMQCEK